MQSSVQNQLSRIRKSRGIGASALAQRVHVSRQTIYAIEAGTYVPNTAVALHLARELEVTVDQIFSLPADSGPETSSLSAEVLSAAESVKGQPVRICQIGARWVSVPVRASPYYLPDADGVVHKAGGANRRADLSVFTRPEASPQQLLLAGCDPAAGILAHMVHRLSGVELVSAAASSRLALEWLRQGKVHVAGLHLQDAKSGEFNLPYIRRECPDVDVTVITFARWEEGLVLAHGNPNGIQKVEDLAAKNIRFVNREPGSGSRSLLDKLLKQSGVATRLVNGYGRVAHGHLAAAYCVASADADCCVATRSAARTFGLHFIPLNSERYDFAMRTATLEFPPAKALLDTLQRATLRRKLEVLAGYDTSQTGTQLV
ncbi:MAG: substrate-binding domain-containing protein [Bryobacteraceae bacterium]